MEHSEETGDISGRQKGEGHWKTYLKDRRSEIVLSGVLMLLVVLVYSLYGLPWGPACYVLVLDGAILLTTLAMGYGRYRRKLQALSDVKNQGEYSPACLPKPEGAAETTYRQILDGLYEKRKEEAEFYAASVWEARQLSRSNQSKISIRQGCSLYTPLCNIMHNSITGSNKTREDN